MVEQIKEKRAKIVDETALDLCLKPLLKALKWRGSKRRFREVLPHYAKIYNTAMFSEVMEHLNYEYRTIDTHLNEIDERLLPCLFVSHLGKPYVLLEKKGDEFKVFDGDANKESTLKILNNDNKKLNGTVYSYKYIEKTDKALGLRISWLRKTYKENQTLVHNALFLSLILNLLALATPIYIMSVYDRVIGASSYYMLWQFAIGIGIAMAGVIVIFRLRANLLAVLGARIDRAIGNHIFERLLYLAPIYTESATVGSQVARIKDFDRLREFMSGPILATFFDVPFIVISIAIIGVIAGVLILIPIVLIIVYIVVLLVLYPRVKRRVSRSSWNGARLQEFLLESISNIRAIKYLNSEKIWEDRYRDLSATSGLMTLKLTMATALTTTLSDIFMIIAGLSVISFGAMKVIYGTLTVGGMIATMILIWRILAPIKMLFNTLPRMQQMTNSMQQINRLMQIDPESESRELIYNIDRKLIGPIVFSRVSFRYQASMEPAVLGMDFTVQPGELIGIVGRNGSGKSSILKLILGLYQPQAGSIRIDNQDIRQINPIELRTSMGYLPQYPQLFYGTIAANLRLAKPDATEAEMIAATKRAGIYEDIMQLPNHFDTSLRDNSMSRLSGSFQQLLCLARAYMRNISILLLDEPGNLLDRDADNKLIESLKLLRGKVLTMMVTHRPSHLKLMDRIFVVEQGQLVLQGKPAEIFDKIPKEML